MNFTKLIGRTKPALTEYGFATLREQVDWDFPQAYIELLQFSNGVELEGGGILYSSSELIERNRTYEVGIYEPDYFAIGDSGGGLLFLIEKRSTVDSTVLSIGAGSIGALPPSFVSASIKLWIESGCGTPRNTELELPELGDVVLERLPPEGLKALIKIKNDLGLSVSIGELKRAVQNLPVRIMNAVPFGKYLNRCRSLNQQLGGEYLVVKECD